MYFLAGRFHSAIVCTASATKHTALFFFYFKQINPNVTTVQWYWWVEITHRHTITLADNSEVQTHTFTTHSLLYKDGTLQRLHQLLKAVERSGLSLVDRALALVTHPLNAPMPVLSVHATWFLCNPPFPRPPGPIPSPALQRHKHKRKSPCLSPPCLCPPIPPIPPLCLCPSLFCSPLPHPKGTHYPSPTDSPRHCSSICLSSFQWPVTSFHFPCDCS